MKNSFFEKMETADPVKFQQLQTWIDQNCIGCQNLNEDFCEFWSRQNIGNHETTLRVAYRYLRNNNLCPCRVKHLDEFEHGIIM